MKVDVKLTGVDGVLKTLSSLPAEVVSKRGGPVKAALAKGARFLRDRERDNLRAVLEPGDESTGLLEQNIIASRGKPPSSDPKDSRSVPRTTRPSSPDPPPSRRAVRRRGVSLACSLAWARVWGGFSARYTG